MAGSFSSGTGTLDIVEALVPIQAEIGLEMSPLSLWIVAVITGCLAGTSACGVCVAGSYSNSSGIHHSTHDQCNKDIAEQTDLIVRQTEREGEIARERERERDSEVGSYSVSASVSILRQFQSQGQILMIVEISCVRKFLSRVCFGRRFNLRCMCGWIFLEWHRYLGYS